MLGFWETETAMVIISVYFVWIDMLTELAKITNSLPDKYMDCF